MSTETHEMHSPENAVISIVAGVIAGAVAAVLLYIPVMAVAMTFGKASLPTQILLVYPVMLLAAFLIMMAAAWVCARIAVAKERQHATVLWFIGFLLVIVPQTDSKFSSWESVIATGCVAFAGALGIRSGVRIAMKRKKKSNPY